MPSAARGSHREPQAVAGDPATFGLPLTPPSHSLSSPPSSWPCKPQLRKYLFMSSGSTQGLYDAGSLVTNMGVRPSEVDIGFPAPRAHSCPQMSGWKCVIHQPPFVSLSSKVPVMNRNGGRGWRLGGSVREASDFLSGHNLTVREFVPRVGLCADSLEPGACLGFCMSLSLCPTPACTLSLSLKNEQRLKKLKKIMYIILNVKF